MSETTREAELLHLTATIVAAHVAKNSVEGGTLPSLIRSVHAALAGAGATAVEAPKQEPAVPVKRSVFPDYIVCLEDGKKMKTLKRHLRVAFGLTPEAYRTKWGLPSDYPMVAPNYAKHRSALAKELGLGRKAAEPEAPPAPAKRASRGKKAEAA